MGITALVMAGGKGTRMQIREEKPLIKVCGKAVIEYVIEALKNAKKVDSIIVATSAFTPKTAKYLRHFPVRIIDTPGKDYVSDMGYASQNLKLGVFLAIAADLPLVTPQALDAVVKRYELCGKPALTVAVSLGTKTKLGMSVEYSFKMGDKDVVPAGINVIDGRRRYGDEWLDQDIYLFDLEELAVNINTVRELQLAERLLGKRKGKPS
ncbi:MAG TPA: NTP transferase domain-containing protein [Candidatus Limnocylindrales bacterium]|nr:NTP transferase domain-containing protein [Candidatus Limnocylindrales bacterium]